MRLIWEEKFEEKLRKKNKEDGLKIKVSEEKQAEEYSHFHTGAMVTLLSRPWELAILVIISVNLYAADIGFGI